MATKITVEVQVNASIKHVWRVWTTPEDICKWNFASDDWHTTKAQNDLKVGGKFSSRMEAKDGSFGFDFEGIYTEVIPYKSIKYKMEDGREVEVNFIEKAEGTFITETFDAENHNPVDMQQHGWQMILNNFKKYAEQSFSS